MTEREERPRLFVAIDLPDAWKDALAELQDAMRRAFEREFGGAAPRLRWTRPEGIHLTLKFLGETPAGRIEVIERALAAAVPQKPNFSLALGSAGGFEDRRPPRVLLVNLAGDPQPLVRLAEAVDSRLGSAGFAPETRPFRPHLTLARLPDELSTQERRRVVEVAAAIAPAAVEPFLVESVHLIRSILGPGGARYEKLRSFPEAP